MNCQGHLFDIPAEVSYLNMAYQSPLLKSTIGVGKLGVAQKGRPYQIVAEDFFAPLQHVRDSFASLIGCNEPNRIAFQPSVSYGMANVVANLPVRNGGNVVLIHEQFPSNVYPFMNWSQANGVEMRFAHPPGTLQDRTRTWNERLIELIDDKTICVSIPHCHWTDGTVFDLQMVRSQCDKVDALLVVDGTQSIGALPFSIGDLKPDALICAAYKFLLGPYGTTLSYYGPRFDDGISIEHNWMARQRSEDFARLSTYTDQIRAGAARYTVGESANFIALPMLQDALSQLIAWTPRSIQDYCKSIGAPLDDLSGDHFYLSARKDRAAHIFGIRPLRKSALVLQQELAAEKIFVSLRGDTLRIAPFVYNTEEDLQRLVGVLVE